MVWIVPLLVFIVGAGAVLGLYAAGASLPGALMRRRIDIRMRGVGSDLPVKETERTVLKHLVEGPFPAVDRLASRTKSGSALTRLIEQSGVRISLSSLALASIASAVVLALVGGMVARMKWVPAVGAAVGMTLPFFYLRFKRSARLKKFEEQFPEALDLLSRAIRAGHAFTTGMGMVADEMAEPVGPEFRKTFDEQNFGLPLKDALNAMIERVPILDVRFFVTAILIQRETGGNLSEILDNLAHVVRERFKILRQVRVHTAHGRFTGYVLMALPAVLAVALSFINPEHMNLLFRERMGQQMLAGAIVMQVIGYIWIKRVVKIEV